jgi:hypothetical protein
MVFAVVWNLWRYEGVESLGEKGLGGKDLGEWVFGNHGLVHLKGRGNCLDVCAMTHEGLYMIKFRLATELE